MNTRRIVALCAIGLVPGLVPAARAQGAPVKVDLGWVRSTPADSTAELAVVAGMTETNGGLNFDGATLGAVTFTVPLGWHVVLDFKNSDPNLQHSAEVIPAATPVPVNPVPPAFKGAETKNLADGVPNGAREAVRFTADKAGTFLIFCAVPGHGAAGMWIRLDVSATAKAPGVSASSPGH